MSLLSRIAKDPLLIKVLRSSGVLLSANTLSLGLSVLQGVMATRLLGPAGFGLIGVVMAFASTVNSLFSFRMSELVVRYGGEYLGREETEQASAVMKAAAWGEATVSVLAFVAVAFTAKIAEQYLAKTPGMAWMFTVYAVGLLANFNTETSTGILQVTDRIKWLGTINLIQSICTTLVIAAAFLWNGSLQAVLGAYLLGKTILGLGMFISAQVRLQRVLGGGWWRVPLSRLTSVREMTRFAISSNLSATIIKIFRESELLWVGFFLEPAAVGYYRVAYTLVHFLAIPADPLIATTFPEINRLIVENAWARLRDFLRRITSISLVYNLALGLGLVFLGRWIILVYSGVEYLDAYPALIALTIGLVFNYVLFWNRPLLLSLGLPGFPVLVTLAVGLFKLAFAFPLVPRFGIAAAGGLLSFYYIASVGTMAVRGLREIMVREAG
jgi:O-antigen/teichoic acid export membrane protein